MFGFVTATNSGVAAYQRALRDLREAHRTEFNGLLAHFNRLASHDAVLRAADPNNYVSKLKTTPYNAAIAYLRDERHREEFDQLREAIRAEMDGEVDAAIESIRKDTEQAAAEAERVAAERAQLAAVPEPTQVAPRFNTAEQYVQRMKDLDEEPSDIEREIEASRQRFEDRSMVPISNYSMALDEIYFLRGVLADEARILDGHLNFKMFPLSRRRIAEQQVLRMRGLAAGLAEEWTREGFSPKEALKEAEIEDCLTRSQWEQQRGLAG